MVSNPKTPSVELERVIENVSINLPNTRRSSERFVSNTTIIKTLTNTFFLILIAVMIVTSVAHMIIVISKCNITSHITNNEDEQKSKIAVDLYPRNYNDLKHAVLITDSPNSREEVSIDYDFSSNDYNPNWDLETNLNEDPSDYFVRTKRNPSPIPELLKNYNLKCKLNSNSKYCQNMLDNLKELQNDLKNHVKDLIEKSNDNAKSPKDTLKEKRSSNFTNIYDFSNHTDISTTKEIINENVQNSSHQSSPKNLESVNNETSADIVKLNINLNDSSSNFDNDQKFSTDKYLFTEVSSVISEHIDLNFSETPQNQSSSKFRSNEDTIKKTEFNSGLKKVANQETIIDHLTVPPFPLISENRRPESIVQSRGSSSESNSRVIQVHHDNGFTSPKATNFDDNIQGTVTSENMKAASQVIVSSGTQPTRSQCYYVPTNQFASPQFGGNGLPITMPVYSQPQYFVQPNFQQQYVMTKNPVYGNIGYQQGFMPNGQSLQMSIVCTPVQMAHMNQVPFVSAVPEILPRSTVSSADNEYSNNNNHPNNNYNNHEDNNNNRHEDNHISSHYRNAEMMANKIYGQHEFDLFDGDTSCDDNSKICVSDGKCLNADKWCDGSVDCEDGSDEGHCPCKSRIHKSRICDGFYDCPLGEDELGCFNCNKTSFSCNEWSRRKSTSSCFDIEERCDGIKHCSNGKDEDSCTMLHNDLDHHPTFCISHSKGFLHKNIKGKWYPVCQNPFNWAAEACSSEMGNLEMPPLIQQKSPNTFHGRYVQETSTGGIEFVNGCSGLAIHVTCMSVKCGIRSNSISQSLRDTDAEENDELYGRKKRQSIVYTPIIALGSYDTYDDYANFYEPYDDYEDTIAPPPPPPPYFPHDNNIHSEDFKNFQEIQPQYNDYRPQTYDDLDTMPSNMYNYDQRSFHSNIPNTEYDKGIYSIYEHLSNEYDYDKRIKQDRDKRGEGRVVGGKSSAPAAWPWVVAIYRNGVFHCGGVIISEQWIMSAAHCVSKYWHFYYEIQAGMLRRFSFSPQEQVRTVTHIIEHHLYDKKSMINDMSLMFISKPLIFNKWIRPACLPSIESAGKDWLWGPTPGVLCTAVGWGATMEHGPDPDHMREVEVPIMSNCKHSEDRQGQEICAGVSKGGRDACQGDSGGPFLCKNPNDHKQWYIAGIVSHGEGCARAGEPGVYTRVSIFKDWIRDSMVESNFPSQTPKTKCPGFTCVFGVPRCLAKKLRCDKIVDCLGGEDEVNCHKDIVGISPNETDYLDSSESNINSTVSSIFNSSVEANVYEIKSKTDLLQNKLSHHSNQINLNRNVNENSDEIINTTSSSVITPLSDHDSINITEKIEHGLQLTSNVDQGRFNTETPNLTYSSKNLSTNKTVEEHTESTSSSNPIFLEQHLQNTSNETGHIPQSRSNVDQSGFNTNSEPDYLTRQILSTTTKKHLENIHITTEDNLALKSSTLNLNSSTELPNSGITTSGIDHKTQFRSNESNTTSEPKNITHSLEQSIINRNVQNFEESWLNKNTEEHTESGQLITEKTFVFQSTSSSLNSEFHDLDSFIRDTDQNKLDAKNTSNENLSEQPILNRNAENQIEDIKIATKGFELNEFITKSSTNHPEYVIHEENPLLNSTNIIDYEPEFESELNQNRRLKSLFGASDINDFEGSGEDPNDMSSSFKTSPIINHDKITNISEDPSIFITSNEKSKSVESSDQIVELTDDVLRKTKNIEGEIVSQSLNETLNIFNNTIPLKRNESLIFNTTQTFPNKTDEVVFKNIAFNASKINNSIFSTTLQNDTDIVTTERQLNLNDSSSSSPDLFNTELPFEKKLEDQTNFNKTDHPLIVQPDEFLDETNPSSELTININTEKSNDRSSTTNSLFDQIDQNLDKEDRGLPDPIDIISPTKTSTVRSLDENETRGLNPLFNGADIESHINKKALNPKPNNKFSSSNTEFVFPEDVNKLPIVSNSTISSNRTLRPIYPQHFECKWITQRIPSWKRCDRYPDCEDGSDETYCSCLDYLAFTYSSAICDGYVDCSDGSDEHDCYSCALTHFQCKINRNCIPNEKVCDRRKDCKYGEDEIDCFALYIGNQMQFDKDARPHLNNEGIVALRTKNTWGTVCEEHWTNEKKIEASTKICNYLGFGGVIDFKEVDPTLENTNHENFTEAHNFLYRNHASSVSEMILPENCKALYVRCTVNHIGNVESHLVPIDLFDIHTTTLSSEYQDMYLWPWIGQVYIEGKYKCLGVLVHLSWVLIENNCWHGLSLENTFATVVLGTKRSIPNIESPYEQIIRVDGVKILSFSTVTLLHLNNGVYVSRYVKPIPIPDFNMDHFNDDDRCLAAGLDKKGNPISIFLTPVVADCGLTNRCFKRETNLQHCKEKTHNAAYNENIPAWSGILVCHRKSNWYPAATYSEPNGICGFAGIVALPNLSHRKNDIILSLESHIMPAPESKCVGVRCKLGQCIPPFEICDDISNCLEGSDENFENCEYKRTYCLKSPDDPVCGPRVTEMKCNDGHYIPKSWFANNINECGDNSDEPEHLTCFSYLARTAPEKVCDGVRHCLDKTDEDPKFCFCYAKDGFKCPNTDYCVPFDFICDGENDCPGGEDEFVCAAVRSHDSKQGSGEVIINKHGIWYPKCFSKPDFTKFELEEICAGLGFRSGHAKQLKPPPNHRNDLFVQVAVDSFTNVSFSRGVISMRKGHGPYAWLETIPQAKICHRLYIECL